MNTADLRESCDACFKAIEPDTGVLMPFKRQVLGSDETVRALFCQACADRFTVNELLKDVKP